MSDETNRGSSDSDRPGNQVLGMAVVVGFIGLVGAIWLGVGGTSTPEVFTAASVSLLASAVAFGLVANAAMRR